MSARRRQAGLTIVELMVAMVISLVLLAGLITVFSSMRTSFSTTKELNQLVNQQRLTAAVVAEALSNAGYYPTTNRTVVGAYQKPEAAFPVMTTSLTLGANVTTFRFSDAGQVVYQPPPAATTGRDMVAVRMMAVQGASPLNCQGGTSTSVAPSVDNVLSVLWVDTAKNQLECTISVNGQTPTTAPVVGGELLPIPGAKYGGVESLTAMYGVDTQAQGSVDRYMSAADLDKASGRVCPDPTTLTGNASSCWPYVRSIRLTFGFASALDQGHSFNLTRTVTLDNALGRNIKAR